ncbi:kappa-type opioid receptor-like [Ptychodera flava]|uniref:kappa-type opioid receptor-like n=1 Tax=Ptychodera flava TaxID=63121 RepID=UPI00396A6B10
MRFVSCGTNTQPRECTEELLYMTYGILVPSHRTTTMDSVNDTLLTSYGLQEEGNLSAIYNDTHLPYRTTSPRSGLHPEHVIIMILVALGIVANSSFLFVVSRIKTMRTLPNFYFVNLALADFGMLISTLLALLWESMTSSLGQNTPRVLLVSLAVLILFLLVTCLCVSLISVCMVSLERYLAICHPHRSIQLRQKFRVVFFLFLSWVFGCIPGLVSAIRMVPAFAPKVSLVKHLQLMYIVMLTSVAVISLFFVVLFYTLIAREMTKLRLARALPDGFVKEEKRVVTLCMSIAALFFVLVGPKAVVLIYHGILMFDGIPPPRNYGMVLNITWYLIIVHFCLNPIMYNAGSQNHRRAFQMAFTRKSERSRRASTTRTTGTHVNGNDNKHHNVNVNANVQVEENAL